MIRQQGRREMLPFTGLEEEVLPESDTAAWEKLERQTGRQRAYLPDPVTPDPLPRRQTGTKVSSRHAHTHRSTYTRTRFFGRKRSWVLIGLLALVVLLISTPALINTLRNASLNNANSPQGISLNKLQSIPSNPHELVVVPPDSAHPAPPILATSAYLLDASTDTTYYALNPFLHLPMLSTTKLMTATLAVEEGNLDQQITITAAMEHDIKQLSADSALFGVKEGETYTLRDLLYGLLFVSGNDAALVIADALAGNEQNFVAQMNQKAQELGLRDTHFVNPHGLLAAGQYSCARDLAVLGLYSLSIPTIKQISNEKTYHMAAGGNHPARVLLNENQFLWWYPGVDAGKTGYDGESDFVQVMLVTRNNRTMVGVVMHTDDWWTDMRDLMDYGSNDYTWVSPRDVDASGQPIPYDNLWNYFAKDTTDLTVAEPNGGAYFVYTGYSVDGPILSYFNKQGGLKKFGYPEQLAVAASGSLINQQFQHGIIQCNLSNNQCQTL
jgi:D-alanyl-D-alanine carboxypeptidase